MSILNGNKADSGPNPWRGKVKVMAVASPWWPTRSIELVCEISIANVLTTLVHVGRSQKSGKLYVTMPSTKRGDEWTPIVQFLDPALAKVVEAAALAAAAGGVPEDAEAETLPF